jgi:hypothetical protein
MNKVALAQVVERYWSNTDATAEELVDGLDGFVREIVRQEIGAQAPGPPGEKRNGPQVTLSCRGCAYLAQGREDRPSSCLSVTGNRADATVPVTLMTPTWCPFRHTALVMADESR